MPTHQNRCMGHPAILEGMVLVTADAGLREYQAKLL